MLFYSDLGKLTNYKNSRKLSFKEGCYFCEMENEKVWMQRALQLAAMGMGNVSPNPMVGCVIVHEDRIIGEGWHRQYGEPHAEVNAIKDVFKRQNDSLLASATAYVTLEPCSHFGKTPPCADLLITHQIKRVVIANLDPNPIVCGKGMNRLLEAGIKVDYGLMASEGEELNKRFFTVMRKKRPYVILKWAETADGFLGDLSGTQVRISGLQSGRMVHQWRSQEDAILVGKNTVMNDNPSLNVRNWTGNNPVRVVMDRNLKLPDNFRVFDKSQATMIVNCHQETAIPTWPSRYVEEHLVQYLQIGSGANELSEMLSKLLDHKINSILVEGGAAVLHAFLEAGIWDEVRKCQGEKVLGHGIPAPQIKGILTNFEKIGRDLWTYYKP